MLRTITNGPRKHHRRRFAAVTWPSSAALTIGRVRLGKRGALSMLIDLAHRDGHGGDLGFISRFATGELPPSSPPSPVPVSMACGARVSAPLPCLGSVEPAS
jgi:hypothetical protein